MNYFTNLTEFEDGGGEDFEVIAEDIISDDKEENEVIVIDSDDDGADVAPVREKEVIDLTSDEDDVFDLGSDEVEFLGDSDTHDSGLQEMWTRKEKRRKENEEEESRHHHTFDSRFETALLLMDTATSSSPNLKSSPSTRVTLPPLHSRLKADPSPFKSKSFPSTLLSQCHHPFSSRFEVALFPPHRIPSIPLHTCRHLDSGALPPEDLMKKEKQGLGGLTKKVGALTKNKKFGRKKKGEWG
ncbi:unnamed protein product [Cuscuta campestris]|uniref:Uncharacterized protein n=1 Tax=Cuscuta campestris TaxID=132261 RepID=A0A484KEY4_9ASTE|nr:unnamed protein product [Cuscuta campestris]